MTSRSAHGSAVLALLLASVSLLPACNRSDDQTAGQKADEMLARAERKTGEIGAGVREAGREAGRAVASAADAMGNKPRDEAITSAVNAKLVRDQQLAALGINVDTTNARVVLRGSVPDTAARLRAGDLARQVDGVAEVSNELNVQPRP